MSMLEVQNLSVRFGSAVIVNDVSFSVQDGDWLMLIGPNGAGKSTIVNAVSRGVPYTGTVLFEGKDVQKTPAHLLARGMGVLAQHHTVGYAFSVEEVVRLGRYAYAPGIFSRRSDEDERSVAEAMELTGVAHIARQSVLTLSGGELQRVFLAQLFAQNPRLLLLDEPTNHLDLVYQKQIFSLVREWLSKGGRAVVSVVHDLSLARMYGSRGVLLDHGKIAAAGEAADVFAPGDAQRRLPHGCCRLDAHHALPMGKVKKAAKRRRNPGGASCVCYKCIIMPMILSMQRDKMRKMARRY